MTYIHGTRMTRTDGSSVAWSRREICASMKITRPPGLLRNHKGHLWNERKERWLEKERLLKDETQNLSAWSQQLGPRKGYLRSIYSHFYAEPRSCLGGLLWPESIRGVSTWRGEFAYCFIKVKMPISNKVVGFAKSYRIKLRGFNL